MYDKCCRIGGTLTLDDLAETEVGDWKMPDFKAACAYAAIQGWLIVEDDVLTLTTAGLAAAYGVNTTRLNRIGEAQRCAAGFRRHAIAGPPRKDAKPRSDPLAIHQLVQAIILRRPPRIGVRVDHQAQ